MENTGQSVAGSEDSFSQAPNTCLKDSTAFGYRAGREPMQGSPGKDSIQEDSEDDRRSNCSMDSQHMINALKAQLAVQTAKTAAAVCEAAATETKIQLALALSSNASNSSKHSRSLERDFNAIFGQIQSPSPTKLRGSSVLGFETPNSEVHDDAGNQTPRPKFDTQDDSTSTAAGSSFFLSGAQVPAFPNLKSLRIHDAGQLLHTAQFEDVKHIGIVKPLTRSQSPTPGGAWNVELVGSLEPAANAKSETDLGAAETKIEQGVVVDEQNQRESQEADARANKRHDEKVAPRGTQRNMK